MKKMKRVVFALLTLSALAFNACSVQTVSNSAGDGGPYKGKDFDINILRGQSAVLKEGKKKKNILFGQAFIVENHPIHKADVAELRVIGPRRSGVVRYDELFVSSDFRGKYVSWKTFFYFENSVLGGMLVRDIYGIWGDVKTAFSFHQEPAPTIEIADFNKAGGNAACFRNPLREEGPNEKTVKFDKLNSWPDIIPLLEECAKLSDGQTVISEAKSFLVQKPGMMTGSHSELENVWKNAGQINFADVKDPKTIEAVTNIFNSMGKIIEAGM
jgi:hypothetical protein